MSDDRALPLGIVLGVYGSDTPCVFELTDPSCNEKASFLVRVIHQDDKTRMCGPESLEWMPVCQTHFKLMQRTFHGFWADLAGIPKCTGCDRTTALGEVKAL